MTVFFYGLFMDKNLLKGKGLNPRNSKRAYLAGYRLIIGEKATLSPHSELRAYGTIMDLETNEIAALYGSAGVEDYVPQKVHVNPMAGNPVEAVTYILPIEMVSGKNSEYATKLAEIAKTLKFPDHYIKEIRSWI